MRPHPVGSACHRVLLALDEAMTEGALRLPPELKAHASRCGRCGPQWRDTEALLLRLREGAARFDLGPVTQVVDHVVVVAAAQSPIVSPPRAPQVTVLVEALVPDRVAHFRWLVGQVAVVATVLVLAVSALAYSALKVNQVLTGTHPVEMVQKLGAPFRDWTLARFRGTR